jgi:light-regulated signal transduction histidine kinase (bacteriophytochrome)
LRAPLRQVSGFVALLQESLGERQMSKTPNTSAYCTAVNRMGHLIDDLLRFSRFGRAELNRHWSI